MASCTWWMPTTSNPLRSSARTRARLRRRRARRGRPGPDDTAPDSPPGDQEQSEGHQVPESDDDGGDHTDESRPGLLPRTREARGRGALRPADGRADLADPEVDGAVRGLVVEDAQRAADLLDAELHLLELGLDAERVG